MSEEISAIRELEIALEAERENARRLRAALLVLRGSLSRENADLHVVFDPHSGLTVGWIVAGALALDEAVDRSIEP